MIQKVTRDIEWFIIHCAFTKVSMDIDIDWIRRLHMKKGYNDVGYNWFIKFDGTLENGRTLEINGAHARGKGANRKSIGVCIEGGMGLDNKPRNTLTVDQWKTIHKLFLEAQKVYPNIKMAAHYHFDKKPCPNFNVLDMAAKHGITAVVDFEPVYPPMD